MIRKNEQEEAFKRIATAISKYWVCKRAPFMIYEAMECLGGAGYVEESILPRLYREAPLNSIWEGSGNVNCLDTLRAMKKDPSSIEALLAEIKKASGQNNFFDQALKELEKLFSQNENLENQARRIVEQMVLLLQASLLLQKAPLEVAQAFCESRLGKNWGYVFGDLPSKINFDKIIERSALKTS